MTLVKLLEACNNGKSVAQLHSLLIKTCLPRNGPVFHKLLSLYSVYFPPEEHARKLFDETLHPNSYTWNSILRCYCTRRNYVETLNLFSCMLLSSSEESDAFTITTVLKACTGLRALDFGRSVHGYVKKCIDSNLFIGSGLIEFYSKCGSVEDAECVFEEYNEAADVVFWTTMVTAYEQNGKPEKALLCFSRMVTLGGRLIPDMITLVSVVSACAQLFDTKAGKSVHGFTIRREFDEGLSLMNAMLNLYSKSGYVKLAATLFMKMQERDSVSWGSLISCYAHNGLPDRALQLLSKMIVRGIQPNAVIVLSVLQACEASGKLETGRQMHKLILQKDMDLDMLLASTALIDMYMACDSPDEAVHVFERMPAKDAISWSSMITGFVQNGLAYKAFDLFRDMRSNEIQPDDVLTVKVLSAVSDLGNTQLSSCFHGYLIKRGFHDNSFIGASLIEFYAKSGTLNDAVKVFKVIKDKDLVVWSSMFAGYAVHGQGKESIRLFNNMIENSTISPNNITFLSILSACSHAGLILEGIKFFNMMVNDYKLTPESKHYSIIVDLLGRTGELDSAMDIINRIPPPVGAHVWGALLGASRIHQNTEIAQVFCLKSWREMAKRKMAEMEKEMADQPKCDDDDPTSKSNRKWDRKGKFCTIQRINEEQGKGEEKEENLGRRCNCDINVSPEMESSKMEDQPKVQPFGKGVSDLICKIREIPVDNEANEVFLFELIRMATGALTTVRMESLVDEEIHGAQPELFIDIVPDFENYSLTIMDTGIGITEDELVRRICNIRGREKFKAIDAATHPDFDLSCYYSNVWGYRLGFHSVYMVAKRVEIDTETTGGLDRYKWVSEGCDSYTISRDDTTLGRRGTKVTLFLERNHWKYLDVLVLTDLVKKYVRKFKYPISIVVDDVDGVKTKREIVDEEKEKRRREGLPFEELKEKFELLRQRFKEVLGSRVKDVVVRDGMDLADRLSRDMTTFEINPRSTIMEALRQKADAEDKDTTAHVEKKKKKKKEKYLYTDGVYWGQETGEDLYREYLLGEEDEEEKEEKMNLKELILHRFRRSVSNIWLFDMRHGTSYLKQHPELGRP